MVDMALVSGAVSSLQATADAIKVIMGLQVSLEVREKVISIQTEVLNVQAALMAMQTENMRLIEENRRLSEQLGEVNRWEERASKFVLTKHATGVSVYTSVEEIGNAIAHACPKCFEDRKIYILKLHHNYRGGETYLCPGCTNVYTIIPHGPEPPLRLPSNPYY